LDKLLADEEGEAVRMQGMKKRPNSKGSLHKREKNKNTDFKSLSTKQGKRKKIDDDGQKRYFYLTMAQSGNSLQAGRDASHHSFQT